MLNYELKDVHFSLFQRLRKVIWENRLKMAVNLGDFTYLLSLNLDFDVEIADSISFIIA